MGRARDIHRSPAGDQSSSGDPGLTACGDPAAALAKFTDYSALLHTELGAAPTEDMLELNQNLLPGKTFLCRPNQRSIKFLPRRWVDCSKAALPWRCCLLLAGKPLEYAQRTTAGLSKIFCPDRGSVVLKWSVNRDSLQWCPPASGIDGGHHWRSGFT